MHIKVGCDIINIKRFERSIKKSGQKVLNRIFSTHELSNFHSIESLAGIFAAKEAVIKALGELLKLKAGDWHNIEITKNEKGKPEVKILKNNEKILSGDISISHDGEYAIAVVVFILN